MVRKITVAAILAGQDPFKADPLTLPRRGRPKLSEGLNRFVVNRLDWLLNGAERTLRADLMKRGGNLPTIEKGRL